MPGAELMLIPFSDSLPFLCGQFIIRSEVKLMGKSRPHLRGDSTFILTSFVCLLYPPFHVYLCFYLNIGLQHSKALILVDSHKEVIFIIFKVL